MGNQTTEIDKNSEEKPRNALSELNSIQHDKRMALDQREKDQKQGGWRKSARMSERYVERAS